MPVRVTVQLIHVVMTVVITVIVVETTVQAVLLPLVIRHPMDLGVATHGAVIPVLHLVVTLTKQAAMKYSVT